MLSKIKQPKSQFVFVYIIDKQKLAKIYLEDISLNELEKVKDYRKGCFVHSGKYEGRITSTIAVSHDGIYCDGINILSSDKKFQGVINTLYQLKLEYDQGRIPYNLECPGFATIFLYSNKDIQITTKDPICECGNVLKKIVTSHNKYVCTGCRKIYKKLDDDNYYPTKKRMSEGSFDRLNK
jgi:hypothetical protein